MNRILAAYAAVFFCASCAFAQDSELEAMLGGVQGRQGLSTGLSGGLSTEQIAKALEAIKGGMNLGATEPEYNSAGEIVSQNTKCTDTGCQIEGNDSFLGKDRKLDASINMAGESGLKIDLKLIDAKTGKVLKTVSRPFDPSKAGALNEATLSAAKKILSGSSSAKKTGVKGKKKKAASAVTPAAPESSVTSAQ